MSSAMCLNPLVRVRPGRIGVFDLAVAVTAFLTVLAVDASPVNALDATASTTESKWCVERTDSGEPPSCIYDNFLSCGMAAITTHGWCKARTSLPATAEQKPATRTARQRGSTSSPTGTQGATVQSTPASSQIPSLSSAKREKLFRQFVEWRRQHADR